MRAENAPGTSSIPTSEHQFSFRYREGHELHRPQFNPPDRSVASTYVSFYHVVWHIRVRRPSYVLYSTIRTYTRIRTFLGSILRSWRQYVAQ